MSGWIVFFGFIASTLLAIWLSGGWIIFFGIIAGVLFAIWLFDWF